MPPPWPSPVRFCSETERDLWLPFSAVDAAAAAAVPCVRASGFQSSARFMCTSRACNATNPPRSSTICIMAWGRVNKPVHGVPSSTSVVCLSTYPPSFLSLFPLSALSTATATTNTRGGGRLVKLTAGPGPGPFEAHQPVSVFPFQPSAQTHADAGPRGHQQLCTIPFLSRRWNVSASVPLRGRSEFVEKVSGHYPSTAAFLLQLGFPTPRRAGFCCPSTPSSSRAANYPCQPRRPYERAAQRRAGGRAHTLPSVSPPLCVLLRCGLTLRSRGPARRSSRLVQLIRCTACGLDPVGPLHACWSQPESPGCPERKVLTLRSGE